MELDIRKSLAKKKKRKKESHWQINKTNEKLVDTITQLVVEKQQNRSWLSPLTTRPVLEPPCVGNFSSSLVLNRNLTLGFPGGSDGKESACSVGDLGSIPGSGRSPGEGNGNPLQYSCLENPRSLEGYSPWGCKESDTTEWLSFFLEILLWEQM